MDTAEGGEVVGGDDADFDGQGLEEDRANVGHEDREQEVVVELGATGKILIEVHGITVNMIDCKFCHFSDFQPSYPVHNKPDPFVF